jgi:hypothetical protein
MRASRVVVDRFVSAYFLPEGDFNEDGNVDAEDYEVWHAAFGTEVFPGSGADGNRDGTVNAADYTVWRNNVTAQNPLAVPEPAIVDLLLIAVAWGGCRRNSRKNNVPGS